MENKKLHFAGTDAKITKKEIESGKPTVNNKEKNKLIIFKSNDAYKEELIDMLEGVDLHALYVYLYSHNTVKKIKYKEKGIESAKKIVACKNRLTEINDLLFQMGESRLDFSIFI